MLNFVYGKFILYTNNDKVGVYLNLACMLGKSSVSIVKLRRNVSHYNLIAIQ